MEPKTLPAHFNPEDAGDSGNTWFQAGHTSDDKGKPRMKIVGQREGGEEGDVGSCELYLRQ